MKNDRLSCVRDLITLRRPIAECKIILASVPWDYDGGGIEITRTDISRVLQSYLLGNMSAQDVEDWANLLEGRDDVELKSALVGEKIHLLANPSLGFELTEDNAKIMLDDLA